jgi:tetratricopeptide (TPR) repeat protein
VSAYERAVALDPGLADAWFALARASGQLGNRDKAIEALRRGLEFNPANQGARAALEQLVRGGR